MFGYIKADKPELKVKEYETYKAVYCSLCKQLGKSYGVLSRLTLSYDFTFLALLDMSLKGGCDGFVQKHCVFNPLKKCVYCKNTSGLEFSSAAAMIMLYYKILDNIADEKGFKKVGFFILRPIFSKAHKKASQKYPDLENAISEYIAEQNALEKADCKELDRICDPSARVLSKIFSLLSEDTSQKRVLERLGYCIGRYIYILDAACDLNEDKKNGAYNVFLFENTDNIKDRVSSQLYFCINEATKAFELLDIKKYKPILGNIIYSGLEQTFLKEFNR